MIGLARTMTQELETKLRHLGPENHSVIFFDFERMFLTNINCENVDRWKAGVTKQDEDHKRKNPVSRNRNDKDENF